MVIIGPEPLRDQVQPLLGPLISNIKGTANNLGVAFDSGPLYTEKII